MMMMSTKRNRRTAAIGRLRFRSLVTIAAMAAAAMIMSTLSTIFCEGHDNARSSDAGGKRVKNDHPAIFNGRAKSPSRDLHTFNSDNDLKNTSVHQHQKTSARRRRRRQQQRRRVTSKTDKHESNGKAGKGQTTTFITEPEHPIDVDIGETETQHHHNHGSKSAKSKHDNIYDGVYDTTSSSPSTSPTITSSPTATPSFDFIFNYSSSPSSVPSISHHPTSSMSPSNVPTMTSHPTISTRPSSTPSAAPTEQLFWEKPTSDTQDTLTPTIPPVNQISDASSTRLTDPPTSLESIAVPIDTIGGQEVDKDPSSGSIAAYGMLSLVLSTTFALLFIDIGP